MLHTHTNANTHLRNYIRPVAHLLPQLCQRLSQTSSPRMHVHTKDPSDKRGGVGLERASTEDGARTQTNPTTGRKL